MPPSGQNPSAVAHVGALEAPKRQPLLERPSVRPAGVRRVPRDLGLPYVSNGVAAVFLKFGTDIVRHRHSWFNPRPTPEWLYRWWSHSWSSLPRLR